MKIKAIVRVDYKDNKDYYRKCYLVGFLKDWTNSGVIAVCVFFNGEIAQAYIKDIKIIDEEYLINEEIDDKEQELYERLHYSYVENSDYVRTFCDGIHFTQADEYKRSIENGNTDNK